MSGRLRHERGFSYVEVLIAAVLVAVALVPAIDSLSAGLQASALHETRTARHYRIDRRMTELLAEPFAALDAEALSVASPSVATSYSDPGGTTDRRLVYLSRFDGDDADSDGDPFTGVDAELLWIRVEIEGAVQGLESLRVP